MEEPCTISGSLNERHILSLCDETLLHIVQYLLGPDGDHGQLVSLASTCTKFQRLIEDRSLSDIIRFSWKLKASRTVFLRYVRTRCRAEMVTKLGIMDLYWVPSGILRDAIVQMPNLTELMAAGARLSWVHLKEILTGLQSLNSLSWSWDCGLEETIRKKGSVSPIRFKELLDLKPKFLNLKKLMLHVPIAINSAPTDLIVCSFTSFVYLISLCKNLEQLYILSWPKTSQERKLSSSFFQEVFETDDIDLPYLRVLVVDVKEPPRIHIPRLILKLLKNFERNKIKPKVLWLDDPLINRQRFPVFSLRRGILREDTIWPNLDLSTIERLSIPIMSETLTMNFPNPFPTCKALQVSHGMPIIVNLAGKFDGASELESLCCNAFNFRMLWRKLSIHHPNLKEVNLCKNDGNFPEAVVYCALAEIPSLQKVSIPLECLVEIKDQGMLTEFSDCIPPEDVKPTGEPIPSTSKGFGFKKRRVGLSTKPAGICGLQLLTQRCSQIKEVEIGYSSKTCHPGRLLLDALFDMKKWTCLRKISLDGVPVKNGKFLIELANSAPLESIRLSHVGPTGKCAYIGDLANTVKNCPNLMDLRLEQNYVGSLSQLLQSLQHCPKLERLLLWSSPNDQPLDCEAVLNLFEKCSNLVVFYAVVEPTLKISCKKLKKFLTDKYKVNRPSLSVFIETSLEDDRVPVYPSVHFRQMVINMSQVCQYNDFPMFYDL